MEMCPCGSNRAYEECCLPAIRGERPAATAEALMRSRYSAYVKVETDYLFQSTHPDHRKGYDHKGTKTWAENSEWEGLEILGTVAGQAEDLEGEVEFIARFREKGVRRQHHEQGHFKKEDGLWYFTDGHAVAPKTIVRSEPKVGRNDPCPCGSGKKFKKCCG